MRTRELTSERFSLSDMNLKLIKSLAHHAILQHKTETGNASTEEQEIYNKNLVAESHDTLGHRKDNIYLFTDYVITQ